MKKFYAFILTAVLSFCGTTQALADDAHPWAGTYTLMKAEEGLYYEGNAAEAYGFEFKDTISITIEWCDSVYMVTNFIGFDLKNMKNGGIKLNVEDDKYATIPTNQYQINVYKHFDEDSYVDETTGDTITVPAADYGLVLWGQDGASYTPITLIKQTDGQIKTPGFGLWFSTGSGVSPVCYYDTCVPLNGGDEEKAYDFKGYYKYTASFAWNMEETKWPETFVMEVCADNIGGYINQFLGYDVGSLNYGAIYCDPDPKNPSQANITVMDGFNLICKINGVKYSLRDGYSDFGPIKLSYNEKNDNVDVDYFNVWNNSTKSEACYYLGGTAVKISAEEAAALAADIKAPTATTAAPSAIYNLNGQRISKPARGIYVKDGKKFIIK